jgi:hypothetical protein
MGDLGVAGAELLQKRLKHARVLLDDLADLLELWIRTKELECAVHDSLACGAAGSAATLGRKIKEVDVVVVGNGSSSRGGGGGRRRLGRASFLLEVLRNAL